MRVRFALVLFCLAFVAAAASAPEASSAAATADGSTSAEASSAPASTESSSESSSSSEATTSSSAEATSSAAASTTSSSDSASPTTSSAPSTSSSSTSSAQHSTSSPVTSMVTATETISGTPVATTHATTDAAAVDNASQAPSLSNDNKSGGSGSGLSPSNKKVVIGVVVGVGGAIVIGAIGLVFWRLQAKRNSIGHGDEADDLMSGTAVGSASREKTPSPGANSTPFENTLDQYHNPGRVNAASNF